MKLTTVHPGPVAILDLDDPATRDRLLELYRPPRPDWMRLNLVLSVSGSAVGVDGTSETLTNAADRRILGVIRQLSDVVLVGAASVRAEGYHLPKRSRLAIVTTTGNLGGHRIAGDAASPVIVMCPAAASAAVRDHLPNVEIVELASAAGRISAGAIVDGLRLLGLNSVVCEGGPNLAAHLIEAGLVDELCVSTSPVVTPVWLPGLARTTLGQHDVALTQLILADDSSMFARWAIPGS